YVARENSGVLDSIRDSAKLGDDEIAVLERAVDAFKRQFITSSGETLVKDEPVEALGDDDVDPTVLRRRRRDRDEYEAAAGPAGDTGAPPGP
ncbi:MAG TPA: hypothetical protein VK053_20585, partial [Jiangellaceae bacterium]|nr:hypothetical protein [Jiangellaceae bacterium]